MKKDPRLEADNDRGGEEDVRPSGHAARVFLAARGWEAIYGRADAHAAFSIADLKILIDGIEDFGGSLSEREIKDALLELQDMDLCDPCGQGCYALTAKGVGLEV